MQRAAVGAVLFLSVLTFCGCRSLPTNDTSRQGTFLAQSFVFAGQTCRYSVYLPPGYTPLRKWPIVLSLHGAGECGEDGIKPTHEGLGAELRDAPERFPCIVVFPQTDYPYRYWTSDFGVALAALKRTMSEYHGDSQRCCLTGYSMGGAGAWFLAALHPHLFAAVVPVCGRISIRPDRARDGMVYGWITSGDPYGAVAMRLSRTPVWVFHGQVDPIVPVAEARRMAAALQAHGGRVRLTVYPFVGHGAWVNAYADPDLPQWMLAQHLSRT